VRNVRYFVATRGVASVRSTARIHPDTIKPTASAANIEDETISW